MKWNPDMTAAPRGEDFINTRIGKNPDTGEKVSIPFNDTRRVDVILASKCGKVMRSYWIPDEQRWCMFSKHEDPVAWMLWPSHPEAAQ